MVVQMLQHLLVVEMVVWVQFGPLLQVEQQVRAAVVVVEGQLQELVVMALSMAAALVHLQQQVLIVADKGLLYLHI